MNYVDTTRKMREQHIETTEEMLRKRSITKYKELLIKPEPFRQE